MAKQMVSLNNPELPELLKFGQDGIRNLLFAAKDTQICLLAASGTGAMEAAVCNFFSPGESVVVCSCGTFGERAAEIALAFGLRVELLMRPTGFGFGPEDFERDFKKIKKIFGEPKAVFFTHNETSTGVTNSIEELAGVVYNNSGAMVVVDSVSSFAISPLKMRDWKIDIVIGGVQKGLMTPPGLSFVAFSAYAKEAMERSIMPRFYFDLRKYLDAAKKGYTPFTPAIPQLRALKEAILFLCREGTDVFERHNRLAGHVRDSLAKMGFEIVAKEYFSDGVTAVKAPEGLKAEDIIRTMREDFGIEIAGGAGELAGKTFRIGHMGYFGLSDVNIMLNALEQTLNKLRETPKTLEK